MKVGEVSTYMPDGMEWTQVCGMPIEAAIAWAAKMCPDVRIGEHTAEEAFRRNPQFGWGNKYGIVIEVSPTRALALYNYDGRYKLLQKRLR